MSMTSTGRKAVELDDYSPEWAEFYRLNPGYRRSVGADGVNDEAETPMQADETPDPESADLPAADEPTEEEAPEEEVEFDFGGNKLRVPKGSIPDEVAERLDQFTKGTWSDYTRKSQDIAERSKAIEARESAVEKLSNLNGETLQAYSQGLALKAEIDQLSQVNLSELWQSDPDQARRISDHLSRKQAEFQAAVAKVNAGERQLTQAQQAELARRMDEGRAAVEKRVKGFSQRAPEVVDYVTKTYGLSKQEAETWPLNPMTAEMAYKAMLFDRMQAKAKKPVTVAVAPVKGMKAHGTADVAGDPNQMSVAEMAEHLGIG